jgi:hypothetical protein
MPLGPVPTRYRAMGCAGRVIGVVECARTPVTMKSPLRRVSRGPQRLARAAAGRCRGSLLQSRLASGHNVPGAYRRAKPLTASEERPVKLHAPFVQLPLQFDAGRLLAEVSALDPSCHHLH